MRGDKADEIERLEEGLARAGDNWLPKTIEAALELKSPEDLLHLTEYGDRLEDAIKIRNGWLYIMIRRKVGHGNFKNYLKDHGRPYPRANDCMNYARAVARHPALAGALAGRALRHILALPEPEVHKLEETITGIPADEAKNISRDWIDREYTKIQKEKEKRGDNRRGKTKTPSPEMQKKLLKKAAEVSPLAGLVAQALSYLEQIAHYEILDREIEKARQWAQEIDSARDHAGYNLRDPKHTKPPWWEMDPMHDDISEEEAPR